MPETQPHEMPWIQDPNDGTDADLQEALDMLNTPEFAAAGQTLDTAPLAPAEKKEAAFKPPILPKRDTTPQPPVPPQEEEEILDESEVEIINEPIDDPSFLEAPQQGDQADSNMA